MKGEKSREQELLSLVLNGLERQRASNGGNDNGGNNNDLNEYGDGNDNDNDDATMECPCWKLLRNSFQSAKVSHVFNDIVKIVKKTF